MREAADDWTPSVDEGEVVIWKHQPPRAQILTFLSVNVVAWSGLALWFWSRLPSESSDSAAGKAYVLIAIPAIFALFHALPLVLSITCHYGLWYAVTNRRLLIRRSHLFSRVQAKRITKTVNVGRGLLFQGVVFGEPSILPWRLHMATLIGVSDKSLESLKTAIETSRADPNAQVRLDVEDKNRSISSE